MPKLKHNLFDTLADIDKDIWIQFYHLRKGKSGGLIKPLMNLPQNERWVTVVRWEYARIYNA